MSTQDRTTTFVYFITADSEYVKIGVTHDLVTRLRKLQTANHHKIQLLYTIECETRERALKLEATLHSHYHAYHVRNEWFKMSPFKIMDDILLMAKLLENGTSIRRHSYWNTLRSKSVPLVDVYDLMRMVSLPPERLKQADRERLRLQISEARRALDALEAQIGEG